MGVVVRRYIDILTIIINFPYSTCISSFFGSSIPTSLFIFKMFFRSLYTYCTFYYSPQVSERAVNHCGTQVHMRGSMECVMERKEESGYIVCVCVGAGR